MSNEQEYCKCGCGKKVGECGPECKCHTAPVAGCKCGCH